MFWRVWLFGRGVDGLDGIDRNERGREQLVVVDQQDAAHDLIVSWAALPVSRASDGGD